MIEIQAGDAANIPAFAYHIAYNFGDTEAEILWWVPGEMHTEEWKEKIDTTADGKWYEREPVTLNGPHDRNEGFPSHLDDLAQLAAGGESTKGPLDMQHLPRSTWLHTASRAPIGARRSSSRSSTATSGSAARRCRCRAAASRSATRATTSGCCTWSRARCRSI